MEAVIIDNQKEYDLDIETLKKCAEFVASRLKKEPGSELNIVFTGKDEIQELNRKYRDIDRPTDVLSFSYVQDKDLFGFEMEPDDFKEEYGFVTIGEILICPAVAKEHMDQTHSTLSFTAEIAYLITHGILHIFGFDHENDEDAQIMEDMQEKIFQELKDAGLI